MAIYFTADLHLGDMEYFSTEVFAPFDANEKDLEKRDNEIIENINKTVGEDDALYILGDFASHNVKEYRNQIKCKTIHLIIGDIDKDYDGIFESENKYLDLTYKDKNFQLCHYPICPQNFRSTHDIWLHGHSHLWPEENIEMCDDHLETIYDVGINAHQKMPVSAEEILDFHKMNGTKFANSTSYETVQLGRYNNKDLDWLVLTKDKNGNKLLVTKEVIDFRPYHNIDENITWQTCDLRNWLNTEFIHKTFSGDEVSLLKNTTNYPMRTDRNIGLDLGEATVDKVFCLDEYEVTRYFKRNCDRHGISAVDLVVPPAKYGEDFIKRGQTVWYWLRSTGARNEYASTVDYIGQIEEEHVVALGVGVRPAMWISE